MFKTFACILNIIATQILLISSVRYISDNWIFSFFYSLQTHMGVLALGICLLAIIVSRNTYSVLLVIASLAIIGHSVVMKREFVDQTEITATTAAKTYRLLSFNILASNGENGGRITDMIIASNADIVYTLESRPLLPFLAKLGQVYPYRIGCGVGMEECDLMMMSKRPFITRQVRSLSDLRRNRFIIAQIDMDGTPVTFAAAHMTKPYFDDIHQEELLRLSWILNNTKGPLVLAGDFNSGIIAPDMQDFMRLTGLKTAGSEPKSWPIEFGNYGISIDHMLARAPLHLTKLDRIEDNMGSNHYGLTGEFVIGQ
jgi:endonuclease/exonuclease/phosphatase (EEP) superfamily protein YafD